MADDIIFEDSATKVTTTLVKIGGVSYPVNGIGSVRIEPRNSIVAFTLAICSAIIWVSFREFALISFIFFVVFLGYGLQARAKLIIRTASGDQTALTAWSSDALAPVMSAIEQAVSRRG